MEKPFFYPLPTEMSLFPERLRKLASNPENLVVKIEGSDPRSLSVLVFERDYPEQITDQTAWDNWQESLDMISKYRDADTSAHQPPATVNPLHAELQDQIKKGLLTTRDRVLLTYRIWVDPDRPQVMFVAGYNGERGAGIAKDFYRQTLLELAKSVGVRFITGSNNKANVDFFTTRLGRVRIDDIKGEHQDAFFGSLSAYTDELRKNLTVQFLYPEDKIKYLKSSG